MATLAFVLFFVLLGLGALALAMSGGQRGARDRRESATRSGRRSGVVLFLIALVGLGIVVPVAVIGADKSRNSIPEANVKELTPLQEHGQELFGQRCRNCHTLKAANASANVGPNLDQLAPPKALVLDAIEKGRARGNGNMAADLVEGEDAEAVAQFVAVATGGSLEDGGGEDAGSAEDSGG
jgi:mono/diheme cytochrome c family protein